jgi:hypothetical protein
VNLSFSGFVILEMILDDPTLFLWLSPLWRGPGPFFAKDSILKRTLLKDT